MLPLIKDGNMNLFYDDDDYDDDDLDYDPNKKVIVGICAMAKKAQSKPMKEILRRLEDYFEYISTLVFDEAVILNKPIEEWPLCDSLISFHSKGFPLSKAIEYARLRKPFLINDLDIQYDIQDRRKVYKILEEADIELPRYVVLDRDSANPEERELVESDDHIEVSNVVFNKPFVEKPISAEDHNICIYYPAHAGGGSQRLFRKIGCRSSVYSNESWVRKTGSYIYEEFMPTDGTDVKVYTAGPDYAHAEARKSPALDGKVERDLDGKEIRYPVILTNREKLIARKVCLAFKQTVCGFDLLRANGRSYVCDVNGFSFVKSSMKYYEDCSKILGNMVLRALAPKLHIPWSIPFQLDDPPIVPTTFGRMMELRCVIAVIRHGDRTPKQKMKLEVKHPKFLELYHKYGNSKDGQAKLKRPKQLQEVLDIARYLLGELADQPLVGEVVEPRVKLKQLKSVLEMYGHFSGINRKVQLKYQPHGRPRRSSSDDESVREPSLVLILKWGGELTPAGRVQAEDLGRCFRRLYPASGDYSGPQGLGLLRLHSTFRHDLKIYASDEGRVQMTAAAFAKGFLALEGELTPILFQMVKSANTNGLLDDDCESSKCQKAVKERLHEIMHKDSDLDEEDLEKLNPTHAPSIEAACKFIGNPYQACEKIHKLIKELNALIKTKRQDNSYTQEYHLYHGETWDLLQRRWAKLEKDFKFPRSKRFDISKIPDIYDCIKYDLQHNQHTLQFVFAHELHAYAKALADIVIPQEYGITAEEKLMISLGTCSPLLRKIQADLIRNADSPNDDDDTESVNRLDPKYSHGVSSPDRHVRTRLYFTSESHIHSLVTALQFGNLLDVKSDEQWRRSMEFLSAISELNYLSQIVIMLYEDPTKAPTSDDRFHVEIHFSSGVLGRISQSHNISNEPQGPGFRPHVNTNKSFSSRASTSDSIDSQFSSSLQATVNDSSMSMSDLEFRIGARCKMNHSSSTADALMIKEEPIDEERSTDGESRANSKSSSACITPKKEFKDADGKAAAATTTISKSVDMELDQDDELQHKIDDVEIDDASIEAESKQTISAPIVVRSKPPRGLARSYSAVTPMSLQDIFKDPETRSIEALTPETVKEEKEVDLQMCQMTVADQDDEMSSLSTSDTITTPTTNRKFASRQLQMMMDDHQQGGGVGGDIIAATTATTRLLAADDDQLQHEYEDTGTVPSKVIPIRNNWKTYEQYLASEQNFHASNRRRYYQRQQLQLQQQQLDPQSLINMPHTYHTVHHCNFSPTALNALSKTVPRASFSMSTSPQQTGTSILPQRYSNFKQMNKQMSSTGGASAGPAPTMMKMHGQNPRARSMADVSQYCVGASALISTAIISGSSPELVVLCPYSPNIRPLETLHNELSLRQFIDFVVRLTRHHRPSNAGHQVTHNSSFASVFNDHVNCQSSSGSGGQLINSASSSAGFGASSTCLAGDGSSLPAGSDNCPGQVSKQQLNKQLGDELQKMVKSNQNNQAGGDCSKQDSSSNGELQLDRNRDFGLSPGNSLSNSLIWSGPPSSFASSPGPSSPGGAYELWAQLQLDEPAANASGSNQSSAKNTPALRPSSPAEDSQQVATSSSGGLALK